MENKKTIPNLVNSNNLKKLPASHAMWESTEDLKDGYIKVNSIFFQATEYPLLPFFKNITKSLPLDEMDKKI